MDKIKTGKNIIAENQSRAKRIKILLKNYDGRFKSYQDLANFKEPVLFLMRNNRKVEFHDNATQGKFLFTHTDGKERSIELSPQFMHTFDYGKKTFKGYVCHEDYPTPLPEVPVITGDIFGMAIDKTLNDMKKWKAEETRAIGDMWMKIGIGIAIVIGAFAVFKLLFPSASLAFWNSGGKEAVQAVGEGATIVARNVTQLP